MQRRLLLVGAAVALALAFVVGYFSASYLDNGISDFSARSRSLPPEHGPNHGAGG